MTFCRTIHRSFEDRDFFLSHLYDLDTFANNPHFCFLLLFVVCQIAASYFAISHRGNPPLNLSTPRYRLVCLNYSNPPPFPKCLWVILSEWM